VFGLGEHHRPDYAVSAPAVALAAAPRAPAHSVDSAVTVLSSDDPVRVYQQFATLDLISGGRAEIMPGGGSFIESFPLFRLQPQRLRRDVREKLDLLLQSAPSLRSRGKGGIGRRSTARRLSARAQQPLPVWIASGARRNRSRAAARSACPWRLRS